MRNIGMHCLANLKKSKSQTASLLLFILIATALLNVGLSVITGAGTFFDRRANELNAPHIAVFYKADTDIEVGAEYFKNYPGVTETERLSVIGSIGQFATDKRESTSFIVLSRVDETQRMDAPSLVGESRPLSGDAVYIPSFMQENDGLRIGDVFEIDIYGMNLSLTVAGTTEEILMGAPMNTTYRFYISDQMFAEVTHQIPELKLEMLTARMKDYQNAEKLLADFRQQLPQEQVVTTMTYPSAKLSRTMMAMMVAAFIAVFAIVLILVCLIVVRFCINTNIEESMVNIGTLKAVGYKSPQILASILLQFGLIALTGSMLGIILGQLAVPAVADVLRPQIALVWEPGFDSATALASLVFVLVMVLLITVLTAQRVKKLHPLIALRGGITTHSFTKNTLPLDRVRGPLNILLAMKRLLQNKGQTVMTSVIIAAVTVAVVMGITLHYSMNVNTETFVRGFFGELADVYFVLKDAQTGEGFVSRTKQRSDVRKIFGFESTDITLQIDSIDNHPAVAEDCTLLEGNMLLEGIYPRHDNEIALGSATARVLQKGTGDTVSVTWGGNSIAKQYIVTGVIQYTNYTGLNGLITGDGMRRLNPNFEFATYYIYVEDDKDAVPFIEDVKRIEGDIFMSVGSPFADASNVLASMGDIIIIVEAGILITTLCVVVLTLYMVIKTTILCGRRELGIQKALGFTTLQLMNQIVLGLTPPIFIGIIVGAVIGCISFNPMLTAMMSSMGIVKASMPIPMDWLVLACIVLAALTYVISLMLSYRIRRISAYGLVSE